MAASLYNFSSLKFAEKSVSAMKAILFVILSTLAVSALASNQAGNNNSYPLFPTFNPFRLFV